MTTHYTPTNEGGMSFTSTRRPGEVRIPNYVYDIWMPLLGIEAIGVYAVYCRLEREGTVKAMSQQRIAQEMRIGVGKLNKTNDLLKRYGFIGIRQPESYEKLMHYTTEITVHDPPRTASAATIRELKHPKGYETLCPWLTETEPQPIGNAEDTNESCANQSGGNANVAPPVFAPSVVAEEPALPDSPADDFKVAEADGTVTVIHYAEESDDPSAPPDSSVSWPVDTTRLPDDSTETEALFKAPPPAPKRRTTAEHKAGIKRAVESFGENGGRPGVSDPTQDADPWADGPLSAFCAVIHATPEHIKPAERTNWPKALAAWSDAWEDAAPTPAEAVKCMNGFLESELNWKTFQTPYEKGFQTMLDLMLNRLRGGLPWNATGKRNGGSSTGRQQTEQVISSDMVVM